MLSRSLVRRFIFRGTASLHYLRISQSYPHLIVALLTPHRTPLAQPLHWEDGTTITSMVPMFGENGSPEGVVLHLNAPVQFGNCPPSSLNLCVALDPSVVVSIAATATATTTQGTSFEAIGPIIPNQTPCPTLDDIPTGGSSPEFLAVQLQIGAHFLANSPNATHHLLANAAMAAAHAWADNNALPAVCFQSGAPIEPILDCSYIMNNPVN